MEIYNETVTDLLCDSMKRKPLEIREGNYVCVLSYLFYFLKSFCVIGNMNIYTK